MGYIIMSSTYAYLGSLDSSSTLTVSGENFYELSAAPQYDSSLTYGALILDLSNVWLYKSDGIIDGCGVSIRSNQTLNFIGDTNSSSTEASFNILYNTIQPDYTINVVVDHKDASGQPEAAENWIDYLAYKAIGTPDPDSAFSRATVNTLQLGYGDAVEAACEMVNNNFFTDTSFTVIDNAIKNCDKAGEKVYKWLKNHHADRFQLGYGLSADLLPPSRIEFNGVTLSGGTSGNAAQVKGQLDPSSGIVNALQVDVSGYGYRPGAHVSFSVSGFDGSAQSVYTVAGSLNSVGAAHLNGSLTADSGVQYPLEANDEFHIVLTIFSAPGQRDHSGDLIEKISRKALLKMKLTD